MLKYDRKESKLGLGRLQIERNIIRSASCDTRLIKRGLPEDALGGNDYDLEVRARFHNSEKGAESMRALSKVRIGKVR